MITAGAIYSDVADLTNEKNADQYKAIIMRAISRAYQDVVGEHFWPETINTFEPSDALCASLPLLLPATLKRIKSVSSGSVGSIITYYEDFSGGRAPIHPYNWRYGTFVKSALQSGTGCSISDRSTTVTITDGTTLGASIVGEYIQIGSNKDVYLIASRDSGSQLTLSVPFRTTEELENVPWTIRPAGIRTITFCDMSGTEVYPVSLKIEFQEKPYSVVDENDIIMLPDDAASAVFHRAAKYCMQRKGWSRQAALQDVPYRDALSLAKRECPISKDVLKPKRMFRRPVATDILATSHLKET